MASVLPELSLDRWLQTIQEEYLADYIPSGGSTVKVVTGTDTQMEGIIVKMKEMAKSANCFSAHLNPSRLDGAGKRPDLHRIDRFFFHVTESVVWRDSAAIQAQKYLANSGIHLAEGRELGDLELIASDNGRDSQDLLNQYQRELVTRQIRDTRLSVDFRTAVTSYSRALLIPDAVTPTTQEALASWFAGKSVPGASSALKKVQIYERININNARSMLSSFCRWLPEMGYDGLVVTFDFRPYEYKKVSKGKRQQENLRQIQEAISRGASTEELNQINMELSRAEPEVFYSDAAYMQMLTLIRRFIDEIDWFERFLMVILTTPNFYKDKNIDPDVKRCYYDYDALQTRIGQEVHDAKNANPAASLVYLGGEE